MEKIIKDFDKYTIDEHGNIFNTTNKKPMAHGKCRAGYHRVYLNRNDGKRKALSVHRLVAKYFVEGETLNNNEVNHKDGNKDNNSYTNLEWCTRSYNMRHSRRILGNKHGNIENIIKDEMINFLHTKYRVKDIAVLINTTPENIHRILRKNTNFICHR